MKEFLDSPKYPIDENYPKIRSIKKAPIVNGMYSKLEAYNNDEGECLKADGFYELFNGQVFKARVESFFGIELQKRLQQTQERIDILIPLAEMDETYVLDRVKQDDLKDALERCSFEDAENAFLSLKLRRNRVAHDYINGLSDTFSDIQKFYDIAVVYVIALEASIKEVTNT